jgi:exosortase
MGRKNRSTIDSAGRCVVSRCSLGLVVPCMSRITKAIRRRVSGRAVGLVSLLIITLWSYRGVVKSLFATWRTDSDYSAGQLVPLIAVFLIWRERKAIAQCPIVPCWWGGITLLILAQASRVLACVLAVWSAWQCSLVITIAGLLLMVAGWYVFRRLSWILLFLLLMYPLPANARNLITGPLQRLATTGSVFLIEAFGARVGQQGNVIMLGENTPIAVAEACSGLRMLTAFIIVAAFIAYMIKRPQWQKAVLLASSIPVAVICNIVRIFLTAMIMLYVSKELGEKFFHDFAGLVMMPAAVVLIFGEIWVMDKLVTPDPDTRSGRNGAQGKSVVRNGASSCLNDAKCP